MTALTKSELVLRINERCTMLTQAETKNALDAVLGTINEALGLGVRVHIQKFGAFNVKLRNARRARNPKNGEAVYVPAKYVPCFRVSSELALNLRDKVTKA